MADFQKIAVSAFQLAQRQNQVMAKLLSVASLMFQSLVSEKAPTVEDARRWRELFSEIQQELPVLTASLASISQEVAPLIRFDS